MIILRGQAGYHMWMMDEQGNVSTTRYPLMQKDHPDCITVATEEEFKILSALYKHIVDCIERVANEVATSLREEFDEKLEALKQELL